MPRAQYASPAGAAAGIAGGLLAVTVLARVSWVYGSAATAARRCRAAHDDVLAVIARPGLAADVRIIDNDHPAVYCLPGHRRIVVTTGALTRLDSGQLDAVLTHERAHLSERPICCWRSHARSRPWGFSRSPRSRSPIWLRWQLMMRPCAELLGHLGVRYAPPWQWAGAPPGSVVAFPLAAGVLAVTIWAALLTVAATGHLTRWFSFRGRLAPAAAAIAGFGAMTVDLIILVLLASEAAAAPGTLAPAPVAAAATASLIRLTLARRAGRRCLAARAALT